MSTPNLGYTAINKRGQGVVVVIKGKSYPVPYDAINYEPLVQALKNKASLEDVKKLITPKKALVKLAGDNGFEVFVDEANDTVKVNCEGQELTGIVADRIAEFVKAKEGFQAIQNFAIKAIHNPSSAAMDQLYKFVERNKCALHPDGDILAFKSVREDYYDKHSGTVHYKVGSMVSMPRSKCNPNPADECSTGLHVGGRDYLGKWGRGARVLILKINPADFVAVPNYDATKARCCRVFVYCECAEREYDGALQRVVERIESGERNMERAAADPKMHRQKEPKGERDSVKKDDQTEPAKIVLRVVKGAKLTLAKLRKTVENFGQRQAARVLGVPRTTIQDWLREHDKK